MPRQWIPEIMYEETENGDGSHIPFIMVPQEEKMPSLIYIFESRETGDLEPGLEGEDVPVVQWDLHQYADMEILKNNLDHVTYDIVRSALGLESMETAVEKGAKISTTIRENLK